jgi:hypothetical protein
METWEPVRTFFNLEVPEAAMRARRKTPLLFGGIKVAVLVYGKESRVVQQKMKQLCYFSSSCAEFCIVVRMNFHLFAPTFFWWFRAKNVLS